MMNFGLRIYGILLLSVFVFGCKNEISTLPIEKSSEEWLDLAGDASYGSAQWISILDSAIHYYPELAEPYYRKAVMEIRQDNYINGMANLKMAAKLDPEAYTNYLGLIKLMELHDYEGAVSEFRKAISLGALNDPVISGHSKLRLGLALKELGKFDEAISQITEYITETGEGNVVVYTYIHRGIAYEGNRNYKLAEADFKKAISLWSKCTEAYYYLGKLLLKMGDKSSACRNAQKAILYKSFIRTNPSRAYTDQLYYSDMENLFDQACR